MGWIDGVGSGGEFLNYWNSGCCGIFEVVEGKIRTAAGKSGCPASKIRIAAANFVPDAGEIGSAACVFGAAEEKIGTAEELFRTPERLAGWAAVNIWSAEEGFEQRATVEPVAGSIHAP